MSALQRRHGSSGEDISGATTFCTCTRIKPMQAWIAVRILYLAKFSSTFYVRIENEVEMEALHLPRVVGRVQDKRGRPDALDNLPRKETLHAMGATPLLNELTKQPDRFAE
jgi:hypothetical protein